MLFHSVARPGPPRWLTSSPEVARAGSSQGGSGGLRGLLGGWLDVGSREWWWVEGHSHGGSHSGKTLGQGGGHAPPGPASPWSCGAQDLWALLVHLYHLEETPGPVSPFMEIPTTVDRPGSRQSSRYGTARPGRASALGPERLRPVPPKAEGIWSVPSLALPPCPLGEGQRESLVTCGGGPRMDSSTGSSRSPWSRPRRVSTVSTTKKYLRGGGGVGGRVSGQARGQGGWSPPPEPSCTL